MLGENVRLSFNPVHVYEYLTGIGKALRILRASPPSSSDPGNSITSRPSSEAQNLSKHPSTTHKSTTSRYGHRLDASRNMWDGSGLKVDSGLTDVGWGSGGGSYFAFLLSIYMLPFFLFYSILVPIFSALALSFGMMLNTSDGVISAFAHCFTVFLNKPRFIMGSLQGIL